MFKRRKNRIISAAVLLLLLIITVPLVLSLVVKNKNDNPDVDSSFVKVDTKLEILESDVVWKENTYTLTIESGRIITNVPVSRIFVNANGIGTQDLTYTEKEVKHVSGATVVSYTLNPVRNLCNTAFDDDASVKTDIYVVYNDISYKVKTYYVDVKSCWIGPY